MEPIIQTNRLRWVPLPFAWPAFLPVRMRLSLPRVPLWVKSLLIAVPGEFPRFRMSRFDSCMDDTYGGALRLHPIQQKGLQLLYSKLPGYDWRKEQ